MKDVNYKWKSNTITVEKKNIAQFDMTDVQLRSSFASYISGKSRHVRLHCNGLQLEMACNGYTAQTHGETLVRTRARNP